MDPTADRRLAPPLDAGNAGSGGREVVIDLSSSDSETESDDPGCGGDGKRRPLRAAGGGGGRLEKKLRISAAAVEVPPGFLDPLPPPPTTKLLPPPQRERSVTRQFWKAGDYDGRPLGNEVVQHSGNGLPLKSLHCFRCSNLLLSDSGMDHIRVHPKFLHSNATSHKWALGANVAALAELLDNSLDEMFLCKVANGATYVNIDMMENKKDGTRMLLVQDDGGGMNPDKMRHCMSLGYSAKSKLKNTIGQYGNGFKTSTMRLGADVLVFSRSHGTEGTRPTQSIGMLSYTFLRSTSKEDIIVPMIDYEREQVWKKKVRTTWADWHISLETIIEWSPYSAEAELLQELDSIGEQGTRIIIYNLWEDEEGQLELDFDADANDIQIRGANRDQKRIKMANQYPNSKHFFTYKHSLRSYASILYLRVPHVFRMILRGKEIQHHNIVNDLMLKKQQTYKPTMIDVFPKDEQMVADVTIGFVKDAKHHIDIQGFNVYHKNRLIKPFWRVWTTAGCHGRGIIGVLEVNFVEPAHDKQDFERTNCLTRLEARLVRMQRTYWSDNHHQIGYGINHANTKSGTGDRDGSPDDTAHKGPSSRQFGGKSNKNMKTSMPSWEMSKYSDAKRQLSSRIMFVETTKKSARTKRSKISVLHGLSHISDDDDDGTEIAGITSRLTSPVQRTPKKYFRNESDCLPSSSPSEVKRSERIAARHQLKVVDVTSNGNEQSIVDHEAVIKKLKDENSSLKESILMIKESLSRELQTERDKYKSLIERVSSIKISPKILSIDAFVNGYLEKQLQTAKEEQETLIAIFAKERKCRDKEEENLKKKLEVSTGTYNQRVLYLSYQDTSTIRDLMELLSAARNCSKR
ncbi:hypothetical protein PR202_gb08487 [Eleusine coracana subsp. coracana]|uniref:Morc S5 domain-containing protein n=1 Tax=Eleusine coracana subsp. coracana TaxID=191504 RepID=A0AAV5EER3_ELECO|nr:hypothetical protein PR202_gb08487 [Eleusine coracana subsp. coracana]